MVNYHKSHIQAAHEERLVMARGDIFSRIVVLTLILISMAGHGLSADIIVDKSSFRLFQHPVSH